MNKNIIRAGFALISCAAGVYCVKRMCDNVDSIKEDDKAPVAIKKAAYGGICGIGTLMYFKLITDL